MFTKNILISLGAAYLMMFSMPSLSATWQTIGIHALVPLCLNAGVICYYFLKKTGRWLWIVPVVLISVLGPLYKEYLSIVIVMILFAAIFSSPRHLKLIALLLLLFFYSLSPSFWINLVFYKQWALYSPYEALNLHGQSQTAHLRFDALNHLFFALPPVIVLAGIISTIVNFFALSRRSIFLRISGIVAALVLFALLFIPPSSFGQRWPGYLTFFVTMMISSSFFKINKILSVVFVMSFLPVLITYRGDIYLMYIVGFLAIILLYQIATALAQLSRHSFLYWLVIVGIVLGFLDQGMNLPAIGRVSQEINQLNTHLVSSLANEIRSSDRQKEPFLISYNRLAKDVQFLFCE